MIVPIRLIRVEIGVAVASLFLRPFPFVEASTDVFGRLALLVSRTIDDVVVLVRLVWLESGLAVKLFLQLFSLSDAATDASDQATDRPVLLISWSMYGVVILVRLD